MDVVYLLEQTVTAFETVSSKELSPITILHVVSHAQPLQLGKRKTTALTNRLARPQVAVLRKLILPLTRPSSPRIRRYNTGLLPYNKGDKRALITPLVNEYTPQCVGQKFVKQ